MPEYHTADPILYGLLKEFTKKNRQRETAAESILWRFLRNGQLGVHFRRQHIVGTFIADFVCLPKKVIIELDGGYHQLPDQQISDQERTEWLEGKGFKVIRFTNDEVIGNTEGVINKIKKEFE